MYRSRLGEFCQTAFLCIFAASLSIACSEEPKSGAMTSVSGDVAQTNSPQLSEDSKTDLSQQLPLEFELSASERDELLSVMRGIYTELMNNEAESLNAQSADPTEGCDRCGRETGFLPGVDVVIDQFLHVEMKALTFGLISWEIDLSLVTETVSDLLGDDAPDALEMSYRISIVRVDVAELDSDMVESAINGELLSSTSPRAVSITSVDTSAEEIGLNFDHGFTYLLYVNAIEASSKLSSPASTPVYVHCFRSEEGQDNGGCVQLNETSAQ